MGDAAETRKRESFLGRPTIPSGPFFWNYVGPYLASPGETALESLKFNHFTFWEEETWAAMGDSTYLQKSPKDKQ